MSSQKTQKTEKSAKGQKSANAAAAEAMRSHGLSYPETHEDFPWEDHRALKVKGKAFVFMGMGSDELNFSLKLPQSRDIALMLPFATPTGYGLGKSGWVSATFPADASPPVDMLLDWIDESYRAIAPKKLIAQIGASRQATAADAGASVAGTAKAPAPKTAKAARASKAPKAAPAGTPAKKKAAKAASTAPKATPKATKKPSKKA
jgi:predicted DNA-binding protein (MmcQ/YjbR family)